MRPRLDRRRNDYFRRVYSDPFWRLANVSLFVVLIVSCGPKAADSPPSKGEQLLIALGGPTLEQRRAAQAELKFLGTNAVPLLIAEMPKIAEMRNNASRDVLLKGLHLEASLDQAFTLLASNLVPFAVELRRELVAGHASGVAAAALARLGNEHAEFVIEMLKHPSQTVRLGAAGAVTQLPDLSLRTNAIDSLLLLLKEERPQARGVVLTMIRHLRIAPEKCLPALLERVEHDPDILIRRVAAGAINDFGTNAILIRSGLKRVLESETNSHVKAIVSNTLKKLDRRSDENEGPHSD